jgi:hypothetical protein
MVTADGDRELGGLGSLATRAPNRRADVTERVPALDQDQDPGSVISQPDVGRTTGIRCPAPELECPAVAGSAPGAHHELLDRQVSGVGRLLLGIAPELDPHRSVYRKGESLPRVERVASAAAPLDRADGRSG